MTGKTRAISNAKKSYCIFSVQFTLPVLWVPFHFYFFLELSITPFVITISVSDLLSYFVEKHTQNGTSACYSHNVSQSTSTHGCYILSFILDFSRMNTSCFSRFYSQLFSISILSPPTFTLLHSPLHIRKPREITQQRVVGP